MKILQKYISKFLLVLGLGLEILILYWFIGGLFSPGTFPGLNVLFPFWFTLIALMQIYLWFRHNKYWKYLTYLFMLTAFIFVFYALTHLNITM
jgi:hypothetical protein